MASPRFLLTLDQGTTSTRAIVFDRVGQPVATAQKELALHCPDNGWVEQNPEDIWRDACAVLRGALAQAGAAPADIAALGITNQRETVIVWDRATGAPVANAIVWQDRRTAETCARLKSEGHEDAVAAKTGLRLDPYFSATKIRWILDNVPGARARAEAGELLCGTVDCFLLWRLTGGRVHATDATNASRTLLFNIVTQEWDDDLLRLFAVPRAMLPEVKDTCGDFGATEKDLLGAAVAITALAGDQQAALAGQGCFAPGLAKATYGTGCFVLAHIGDAFRLSRHRMLTTVALRHRGAVSYAIEGAAFVAGAAVQWLRDGLGIIKTAADTEGMASSVPDTGGVYMVPAFTGLGAPHWDAAARGAIIGLTRATTAAHIARAALEAQAYQTQDLLGAIAADAGCALSALRVDGGMAKNGWMCQFLADIAGMPVVRSGLTEATAQGAALLAGLGAGVFSSTGEIAALWQAERRFAPALDTATRDQLYAGWQAAVQRVLS